MQQLESQYTPEYNPDTGEELEQGCLMRGGGEDGLCSGPCPGCAQERLRREGRVSNGERFDLGFR